MYFIPHTIAYNLSLLWAARQDTTFWIGKWSVLDVKIKTLNYNFLSLKGISRCKLSLSHTHTPQKIRKQMYSKKPVPSLSPKSKIETLIKPGKSGEELRRAHGAQKLVNLPHSPSQFLCMLSKGTDIGNGPPFPGAFEAQSRIECASMVLPRILVVPPRHGGVYKKLKGKSLIFKI